MNGYNKVILIGNLTRDPELKSLPGGSSVAELGLAINEDYTAKDGGKKEQVTFVDIEAWGRTAENAAQYLSKGDPVLVEGSLKLDQWETDGQKRSKMRVRAFRVVFLPKPKARDVDDLPQAETVDEPPRMTDDPGDDLPF